MKYLILVFRSRNNLLNFANILKSNLVPYSIQNTPQNITSSCTLSLKVPHRLYSKVLTLIKQHSPTGFLGLFEINNNFQTQRLI